MNSERLVQLYTILRLRSSLVILLVGNEIERICTWNNPLNRLSLQIPEQKLFNLANLPSVFLSFLVL